MAIPDRLENKAAIEAAKAEILAAIAQTDGKLDVGVTAKAVKNIQRGSFGLYVYSEETETEAITLGGFTNPEKMIVLLNGSCKYKSGSGSDYFHVSAYVKSLSATELVVCISDFIPGWEERADGYFSYQVIEFF